MKKYGLILLLILLGAASCTREEAPSGGSLRLVFETGEPETKADDDIYGHGAVRDGGKIWMSVDDSDPENPVYTVDLCILVADASGAIVGKFNGLSGSNVRSHLEGTPYPGKMSVSITDLTPSATYTVYAFANTLGLWTMKSGGSTVDDLMEDLTTAAQVEALEFHLDEDDDLDAYGCLKIKNSRLPLSAKGTVTLSANANGEVSLDLLRCAAKVTAIFDNQYGEDLSLLGFSNTFYHMNPSMGYVTPHSSDFPVEHDSADDGDISAGEANLDIVDGQVMYISWYVLPSVGPYTCDISFKLDPEDEDPHTYTNLPVHDDHARNIPQLARNQHLSISTRISKGKKVSFNFKVEDWAGKTENVYFD